MDTVQPQVIVVKNCPHCQQTKAIDEFYLRSDGHNYNSWCKACMMENSQRLAKRNLSRLISLVDGEREVLALLHQQGIPAVPGKALSHKWADIIAWGIVRIEVKCSTRHGNGECRWGFTPKQVREGVRGQVIVLMQNTDVPVFYVLPSQSPVFYRNGERKTGVLYPLKTIWPEAVTANRLMAESVNHWSLINETRDALCEELRRGHYDINRRYR